MRFLVGNQLPILLISFIHGYDPSEFGWESVTNPLDKLLPDGVTMHALLGISYQSS